MRKRRRCRGKGKGKGKGMKGWRGFCMRNTGFDTFNTANTSFKTQKLSGLDGKVEKIYDLLPKLDCGSCGYESCFDMAKAIASGVESPDACVVAGDKIADKIEKILRGDA